MDQPAPSKSRRPLDPGLQLRHMSHSRSLAIRKELALAQAALDRLEIAHARHELRESVSGTRWLGLLVPRSWRTRAGLGRAAGKLLRSRRTLGLVLSFVLARYRRKRAERARRDAGVSAARQQHRGRAGRSARLGSVALAAVEAWRVWRRVSNGIAQWRGRRT